MNKKINNDLMEQEQKQHQFQRLIILVPRDTRLNL